MLNGKGVLEKMVTVVYPVCGTNEDAVRGLKQILNQAYEDFEVLILSQGEGAEALGTFGTDERISVDLFSAENTAQLMNRAFAMARGNWVLFIPSDVTPKPDFLSEYARVFSERVGMVYGDYEEVSPDGTIAERRLLDVEGDITERASFGRAKGFNKEAVLAVGGVDETYRRAESYDLRLRLSEFYDLVRVGKVLYSVHLSPDEACGKETASSKLFFPGEGKYGGFSYLFYDKDEEKEIERAFENYLRRIEAYLTHENAEVIYEPGERFEVMVTVVIPVYNRVRFIRKAVESVLWGTYQDFEIVVVDNGSTDGTLEEVESLCQESDKVKLIRNDRNVIAYSLNLGLRAARGKYISQLDSDDMYTPYTLERMVGHLESHPRCGMAVSYYDLIDSEDRVLDEFGVIKHLEYNRNNILRVDGIGAVRMWHKKIMLEFGGFDEGRFGHYGEDYDLYVKVSEKYDIDRIHEVCYHYRRHPGNTDAVRDPRMKIANKTLARQLALKRRIAFNRQEGNKEAER